ALIDQPTRRKALRTLAGAAALPLAASCSAQEAPAVRRYGGPVRPEWFGGKPDGATDNASALGRAVKAAAEHEQVLDLSTDYAAAIWSTNEPVFVEPGITLKGGGYRSRIAA